MHSQQKTRGRINLDDEGGSNILHIETRYGLIWNIIGHHARFISQLSKLEGC
jgi:hypothetical protein